MSDTIWSLEAWDASVSSRGYNADWWRSLTPEREPELWAELRAIFDTNFFGTINTIRPAVEHMLEADTSPRGHVLICSSCLARFTVARMSAYAATKAAQVQIGGARIEAGIYAQGTLFLFGLCQPLMQFLGHCSSKGLVSIFGALHQRGDLFLDLHLGSSSSVLTV